MKTIFIFFVILGIFGYVLYVDILPFSTHRSTVKFTPSVESIQQISNVLLPGETQIVYYSFQNVPEIPDKTFPLIALKKAIDTWEENNPQLKFIQSDNPHIEIHWQEYSSSTHTGLAICNSVLFGILSHCILDISVGSIDCNEHFIQNDENMVVNILMHEIGHALKLGHTNQTDHLMYSNEFPIDSFDNKGYVIPERYEEFYIGQKSLLDQEKKLRSEIDLLEKKLSQEKFLYDEYSEEYSQYGGQILSPEDYLIASTLFNKLTSKTQQINGIITQQNLLIDKVNKIVNELGCTPNFEISK